MLKIFNTWWISKLSPRVRKYLQQVGTLQCSCPLVLELRYRTESALISFNMSSMTQVVSNRSFSVFRSSCSENAQQVEDTHESERMQSRGFLYRLSI